METGEPDSAEVTKFCTGVRDLINTEFERFNDRLRKQQETITDALENFSISRLCSSWYLREMRRQLAKHAQRIVDDLLADLNDTSEVATFQLVNQSSIYKFFAEGTAGAPIDLEFGLANWGKVETPVQAYYGTVSGEEVASWHQYGERLFKRTFVACSVRRKSIEIETTLIGP